MNKIRNWTVLFIGGASGTGKSTLAYDIARTYGVNVLEIDDIHIAVESVTTEKDFPAIHYWDSGVDWKAIGVQGNVKWLTEVSKELIPALKNLVDRHIEEDVPIIIEGDFIDPEFTKSFSDPKVKAIFLIEQDANQIIDNYLKREGGDLQQYRAEISVAYGKQLANICRQKEIKIVEPIPYNTLLARTIECLND